MIIEPYTWYNTEITEITAVASRTIAIRVTRPKGYSFKPGQYAIMRVYISEKKFLVRQYSFSSAPTSSWLEFTIQLESGGEVTSWLHSRASPGVKLEISQSFGQFTFNTSEQPKLFIAGRVGIAPFMSYIRENGSNNLRVIYSVRAIEETCYWDELQPFTSRVITSERPRINAEELRSFIINMPIIYICGSRQFAEAMQTYLVELSIPVAHIKRELFTL